jgi:nitrate/nitrite transporter NarK
LIPTLPFLQLTVDNMFAEYFYDHFGLSLSKSGDLAAVFGLFNIFSRAAGGFASDYAARQFGMRGRLWAQWAVQTIGGEGFKSQPKFALLHLAFFPSVRHSPKQWPSNSWRKVR